MKKISKKEQFINAIKTWSPTIEASNESTNLCMARPDDISFYAWVKQTDWTLGAIISLFQWQCLQFNGGIDWPEFEDMYYCFKSKIYACFE